MTRSLAQYHPVMLGACLVAAVATGCTDKAPTAPVPAPRNVVFARAGGGGGPKVNSTSPDSGAQNTTLSVHVLGSGFSQGTRAIWAINGDTTFAVTKVKTNSTTFVSSTELVANITISSDASLSLYDVVALTADGKKGIGIECFTVTTGYTVAELTTFSGDVESFGVDVNDAGSIVGYGVGSSGGGPTLARGFVWHGASLIPLSDATIWSRGLAISNSSPLYVAGDYAYDGNSHAALWTVDPGTGTATVLSLSSGFGYANGVNDAGTSVGVSGSDAVMWDAAANATVIAPPVANTFTSGLGRDINNTGEGVFNFSGPSFDRTYLRTADGTMIELPPLSGDVSTYGRRVSEVSGTTVYVAGTSFRSDRSFHGIRWTIDLSSKRIVNTESRSETSSSSDVSTGGSESGSLQGRLNSTPFLWRRTTGLVKLNPPKGGATTDASGISDNGIYLVGQASFALHRRAVLWILSSP